MFKWITVGAVAGMIAVGSFFMADTDAFAQAEDGRPVLEQVEQRRGGPGQRGAGRMQDRSEHKAAVAEILGLTVDELEAAREAGQRLEEIVEAQGLTMEEFHAEMQAVHIAQINQAVADGDLTQEEADAMIERIESGEGGPSRGLGRGSGRGGPGRDGPGHGTRR